MTDSTDKRQSTFAIALQPEFTQTEGEWSGGVTVFVEEDIGDDLNTDQLNQIRGVCGMLVTCIQLLEKDDDFREYVQNTMFAENQEIIDQLFEIADEKPNFTKSDDGKVITLDFTTKTYGSA